MLLCTGGAIGTRASKSLNPMRPVLANKRVIVYDSEGKVCYPWEALKEKPTATVTAREFIEYVGGMAAMERRDEERRKADKDALWR